MTFFRSLAREIHRGGPYLHELSIPVDEFREFVGVLLFARLGKPNIPTEEMVGFDHAADCIFRRFVRDLDVQIIWETLDQALAATVSLFYLSETRG